MPVNTRFVEHEVQYVVDDSGSVFSFVPGEELPDGEPLVTDDLGRDDLAAIFYTSGTTGFPKGAMTSHENFLANSETAIRVVEMPREEGAVDLDAGVGPALPRDRLQLAADPAARSSAARSSCSRTRSTSRASSGPCARAASTTSSRCRRSTTSLIGSEAFGELDVSHVRWLAYGGAPIAPSLVERIQAAFPQARVGNGFGLTESASILTYLPHEDAAEHADSVGYAAPPVDLDIGDPDPETGVGELLARGPNVVRGYWNKEEATAETFTDGWLHSGDLARMDDEGRVYLVDRAKDMINRGGENVYSIEVESALAGAPGVGEAAVVPVPDDMMGEKVGAVIVPAPRASSTSRRSSPTRATSWPTSRSRSTSRCAPSRCPATRAARCSRASCASPRSGATSSADSRREGERNVPEVQTVQGPVDAGELGYTLIHEHVRAVDEATAEQFPRQYDPDGELAAALEAVNAAKGKGVQTIVEPTAMLLGRDVELHAARWPSETGVRLVPCTGIYTYDYLPLFFQTRSEDQIAEIFVADIEQGIQGTDIKAAFLKCAADEPGVTENVEKLHRACARASVQTGAPIMAHSRPASDTAPRQIEIFLEEGVAPEKIQIAHCGDSPDPDYVESIIDKGVYAGLDRYGIEMYQPLAQRNVVAAELLRRGHAERLFIGQDFCATIDWFPPETIEAMYDQGAVKDWSMHLIFDAVLPVLRDEGVLDEATEQTLFVDNAVRWLLDRLGRGGLGLLVGLGRRVRGEDGDLRVVHDVGRHRAGDRAAEAPDAARAEDDRVVGALLRQRDDLVARLAAAEDRLDPDVVGHGVDGLAQRLLHGGVGVLLQQRRRQAGRRPARGARGQVRGDGDDRQLGVVAPGDRHARGEGERAPGVSSTATSRRW